MAHGTLAYLLQQNFILLLIIGGAVIFTILVFFIILFIVFYQRRRHRYQAEQQELRNSFQRELLKTQLETQEHTLRKIGDELHDNIGQLLSSTKMFLALAGRELGQVPDSIHTAETTLAKAILELRALSKLHNQEWLHQFDLIDNIRSEATRINAGGLLDIRVESNIDSVPLNNQSQVMLFRVVQEALHNCIKHAGATALSISVAAAGGLRLVIADNGRGFDPGGPARSGVGLLNMKHRVQLLGGDICWHSRPGAGTRVEINLPDTVVDVSA
ncbi:Signal transduction histidine kinase [Cnuella takakiae]|uniref:Oxygen sensor histidine kinase NreB n=1 Tax=Cnuella takakiae TaxID=1302690 RepID=A0A1M4TFI3_9BACT|nr:ATP-binding protein [Cnuella takakiae]OLY90728.1 hypothetical protein BUE76_01555 [Cnuella takakiae]SHE43201.1 Signal transduction histidine kinase [Cnuella takakiae]